MELDKVFRLVVILAWRDLLHVAKLCSVRLEYLKESDASLNHL